jgi:FkbM family methyltransferase
LTETADAGPILTHPHDRGVGRVIRETGSWEPGAGRLLRSLLRPGMNAIDVGANIGYFTLLMARAVGEMGRVLAVEAGPETFQILRANIELGRCTNVESLPVAAGCEPGMVSITSNPFNHGGSTALRAVDGWRSTPVQAVALDDVLDPGVPVDVIKIDIEGMDHVAVQGLSRTIERWKPVILVEFNPGWLDTRGDRPKEILRDYRDRGYLVQLLGEDALRFRDAGFSIDELLLDNLLVTTANEADLLAYARRIDYVNLILLPNVRRGTGRARSGRAAGRRAAPPPG